MAESLLKAVITRLFQLLPFSSISRPSPQWHGIIIANVSG